MDLLQRHAARFREEEVDCEVKYLAMARAHSCSDQRSPMTKLKAHQPAWYGYNLQVMTSCRTGVITPTM